MSALEMKFLIWACVTLLAVLAFVGILFINYFMQMAKDVNAIKTALEVYGAKHENLERRVDVLENEL